MALTKPILKKNLDSKKKYALKKLKAKKMLENYVLK